MEHFSTEQADALERLLKKEDYCEPDESQEEFDRRFDSIKAAFLVDIDEGIPLIQLAARRGKVRQKPAKVQVELDRLRKAINKLSDDARIHIAEWIEIKWLDTHEPLNTPLDKIHYAVEQKYQRSGRVTLQKRELCRLLRWLNEAYIIPTTSREELVEIIASAAGIKAAPSDFRHCMDKKIPPKLLPDPC